MSISLPPVGTSNGWMACKSGSSSLQGTTLLRYSLTGIMTVQILSSSSHFHPCIFRSLDCFASFALMTWSCCFATRGVAYAISDGEAGR